MMMSHWRDIFKKVLIGQLLLWKLEWNVCTKLVSQRGHGKNGKWNKELYLDVNESLSDGQAHG